MNEKEYSVSEAVRLIGVESHVLRYWEEELQIAIRRSSQGHRIYSEENVDTFRKVKALKEGGLQLKAIRVLLEGEKQSGEYSGLWVQELMRAGKADEPGRAGEAEIEGAPGRTDGLETENGPELYEIISVEEKPDNLRQFEEILKNLVREAVAEENEKMEQTLTRLLKEELEEQYFRYVQQIMLREAAAAKKKGFGAAEWLRRLGALLRRK